MLRKEYSTRSLHDFVFSLLASILPYAWIPLCQTYSKGGPQATCGPEATRVAQLEKQS